MLFWHVCILTLLRCILIMSGRMKHLQGRRKKKERERKKKQLKSWLGNYRVRPSLTSLYSSCSTLDPLESFQNVRVYVYYSTSVLKERKNRWKHIVPSSMIPYCNSLVTSYT